MEPSKAFVLDPEKVTKKLQIANDVKRFQLRKKFPELSEREINHKAYALIERGCT